MASNRSQRLEQAMAFLLSANFARPRSGALGAKVQNIGAAAELMGRFPFGSLAVEEASPITEGIRGDVDHPHHGCALLPAPGPGA